jgi:Fe(3+) dicitrate transport protein
MSRALVCALGCLCAAAAHAQTHRAPEGRAPKRTQAGIPGVLIRAPWLFNRATRYAHSMPELSGPDITVTKKTTVVRLAEQPPIIDNHERELFDRMPGIVLAEQQNPTELNINYRGLGNPQESEYILLMQDGVPMEMDWIAYPTLYYIPIPQTIREVQMIRGGSGLLYGPEPEPVINFVSKKPSPATSGTIEQVGGERRTLLELWLGFRARRPAWLPGRFLAPPVAGTAGERRL